MVSSDGNSLNDGHAALGISTMPSSPNSQIRKVIEQPCEINISPIKTSWKKKESYSLQDLS